MFYSRACITWYDHLTNRWGSKLWVTSVDMRHIQYQGETLPPSSFPLVLAFHLVLGKFHSYIKYARLDMWGSRIKFPTWMGFFARCNW